MGGGRRGSSWWKEIARIRDGVSVVGETGWFEEGIVRRIGNGEETLFWTDSWLGGVPLSVRYRCLFDLSL
ncbi:cysteine-rich receptor-like protein kinase, partial [Trifolium medium]|nr:cysteine-rich receptor-like protein kinase [Trifolium medium]